MHACHPQHAHTPPQGDRVRSLRATSARSPRLHMHPAGHQVSRPQPPTSSRRLFQHLTTRVNAMRSKAVPLRASSLPWRSDPLVDCAGSASDLPHDRVVYSSPSSLTKELPCPPSNWSSSERWALRPPRRADGVRLTPQHRQRRTASAATRQSAAWNEPSAAELAAENFPLSYLPPPPTPPEYDLHRTQT